jgi:hypothetical protein
MLQCNWREEPVTNITDHITIRSHKRYQLDHVVPEVRDAWALLVTSAYSQDLSVQDGTGIPHMGGDEGWAFEKDRHTPTTPMCQIYNAWSNLITAAAVVADIEPFRYDLVNTGREVLVRARCVAEWLLLEGVVGSHVRYWLEGSIRAVR